MTFLLCPECCQWREPVEGRCPVCAGTLDLAVPDLSLETLANEIGDLHGLLGESELSRSHLPKRGRLYATTNGLLFVPRESRVIVFTKSPCAETAARQRWLTIVVKRVWSRLRCFARRSRFDCEQRPSEIAVRDRLALAELLLSDPGVWFLARGSIASWRRQRGQWDFIRPDAACGGQSAFGGLPVVEEPGQSACLPRTWPERISMRDRDGDRALQTWLETTECPLPVNVR